MAIGGVTGVGGVTTSALASVGNAPAAPTAPAPGSGFAQWLDQALQTVSNLSNQADALAATYAAGGPVTVDQLMIAEQQASLALSLVVQTRDRIVNAYQTLMNMQL